MRIATEMQLTMAVEDTARFVLYDDGVACEIQATRCHAHFGVKPASHGFAMGTPEVDFRPGKDGLIK